MPSPWAARSAFIGALDANAAHQFERTLDSSILDQGVALDLARGARERLMAGGPLDRDTTLQFVEEMIRALEDAPANGRGLTRIAKQLADYAESAPGRIGVRLYDVVSQAIFRPFARRSAAGKRMGLGLAISHSIVAAHAGTLTVTSVLGQGSTFRIELPSASTGA